MVRAEPPEPEPDDLPRLLLWRLRSNPLRRRADAAQGWIAVGLAAGVLAAVPVVTVLAGKAAHRHYEERARHQAATRHAVPAVLLRDAPRHPEPGSDEAAKALYTVPVRFTDPRGHLRTGRADVPPSLPAGSTVPVWLDADGEPTGPPLTPEQVRNHSLGCALVAALSVPLGGAAVYRVAGRRIERRNLAGWDTAWARTAPGWTISP
ncbi:hypothetical protein [Streptomyces sp. NPDC101249]|uniref:Rv1733c family protein n=1 Tax=Streptomyces sp. NPDC101249 TaxID=3366140 RepID=UPI0038194836